MEAKDTVLSNGRLLEIFGTPDFTERQGREAQAEVSFKAGMESGNQKAYEIGVGDGKVEGIAKGIKEVLNAIHYAPKSCAFYVRPEEWQAKLKEWGIE